MKGEHPNKPATARSNPYTRYPRATLWLIRSGELAVDDVLVEIPSFYIGKHPITNEQYEAFRPEHRRSACALGDDDPVVEVSFEDARAYCEWYANLTGKYFRLPTVVEWEFACRGGDTRHDFFDETAKDADRYLWDQVNSSVARPVGLLEANPVGLHDMLGNVWEWTTAIHSTSTDRGPAPILKGGSFRTHRNEMVAAVQRSADPHLRADDIGFRILRLL